jgi:hypothetical protein
MTPPTRLDVAMWVKSAMGEMKAEGQIVRNACRKTGFEWFVDKDGAEGGV